MSIAAVIVIRMGNDLVAHFQEAGASSAVTAKGLGGACSSDHGTPA